MSPSDKSGFWGHWERAAPVQLHMAFCVGMEISMAIYF